MMLKVAKIITISIFIFFTHSAFSQNVYLGKDGIMYKKGKKYSGIIKNEDSLLNYKLGKLDGEQIIYRVKQRKRISWPYYTSSISRKLFYANGIIEKVYDYDFHILDTLEMGYACGEDSLIGIYKNGLPYNGYFRENDNFLGLVILVTQYDKGIKTFQYSKSLISKLVDCYKATQEFYDDLEVPYQLNLFTKFVNGEPYNGVIYFHGIKKDEIFEQFLKNGKNNRINYCEIINIGYGINRPFVYSFSAINNGYSIDYITDYTLEKNHKINVEFDNTSDSNVKISTYFNDTFCCSKKYKYYPIVSINNDSIINIVERLYYKMRDSDSVVVIDIIDGSYQKCNDANAGSTFYWDFKNFISNKKFSELLGINNLILFNPFTRNRKFCGNFYANENNKLEGLKITKDNTANTFSCAFYEDGVMKDEKINLTYKGLISYMQSIRKRFVKIFD